MRGINVSSNGCSVLALLDRCGLLKVAMGGGDCKVATTLVGALHGALTGYSFLPRDLVTGLLVKQTTWLNVKINHLLDLMAIP